MGLVLIVRNLPRQERFNALSGLQMHIPGSEAFIVLSSEESIRADMTKSARISIDGERPAPFVRASTPSSDTALKFLA